MTGILDRMKNTTVADLEGVRSDFNDLPKPVYVRRTPKDMVRTVEGATDLRPTATLPNMSAGMVTADPNLQKTATGAILTADNRTEGQVRYMDNLIAWITEKDADLGAQARTYTDGMTEHGKWETGRDSNVSRWIDRLKAKLAELKLSTPRTISAPTTGDDAPFQDIPNGYYAVADAGSDDIHYFRISRFRDGGIKVQEQASDELHPVRRGSRRTAVLTTIQHVGPDAASALYGQTIGRCGRCNRTLTDATSRAYGIGPDCRSKM